MKYLFLFLPFFIHTSCCKSGFESGIIELNFKNSSAQKKYPSYKNGRSVDYIQLSNSLILKIDESYNNVNYTDSIIYIFNFDGSKYDSIEKIIYQGYNIDRCVSGVKTSFRFQGKIYEFSENHKVII